MSHQDATAADMTFSAALERVFALAGGNLPDEDDVARDPALAADARVQSAALATVGDLLETGYQELDERFVPSADAPARGDTDGLGDNEGDPAVTSDAIRMVLAMARHAAVEPDAEAGPEEAAEHALDARALELAERLVAAHGPALDDMVRELASPAYH